MAGLSALGEGLLSGIGGAMQGVEGYIQTEREQKNKRSLEEFRAQKEMELEKERQKFETHRDNVKNSMDLSKLAVTHQYGLLEQEASDTAQMARTNADNTSREKVASMKGEDSDFKPKDMAKTMQDSVEASSGIILSGIGKAAGFNVANLDPDADLITNLSTALPIAERKNPEMASKIKKMIATIQKQYAELGTMAASGVKDAEKYKQAVSVIEETYKSLFGEGAPAVGDNSSYVQPSKQDNEARRAALLGKY